jgi:hypothetical protein
LIALLASCQPLPHPFADDRPPAELLQVPESAGVSIAPIEGEPSLIAARLGAATARALVAREIPASEKTSLRGSYQLYGGIAASRMPGDRSSVTVQWRLEDASGRKIGEREVRIEATADDWQAAGGATIDRLGALSADAVAPLLPNAPAAAKLAAQQPPMPGSTEPSLPSAGSLAGESPLADAAAAKAAASNLSSALSSAPAAAASQSEASVSGKPEKGRLRVAVRRVTGAPGDGGAALARALASALRQQNLVVVEPGDKPDLLIDGDVSLAPKGPETQHVKIVWRVRDPSGAELGTVGQENDVPRSQLSGSWGDVAYVVAAAAGEGLVEVFARAAAPAHAAAGTGPAPLTGSPNPGPGRPPAPGVSQPSASRAEAGKTKEKR